MIRFKISRRDTNKLVNFVKENKIKKEFNRRRSPR